eukprot:scaffold2238_cov168-Pinguiococcus_pyrenoidosus.AAC.3
MMVADKMPDSFSATAYRRQSFHRWANGSASWGFGAFTMMRPQRKAGASWQGHRRIVANGNEQ